VIADPCATATPADRRQGTDVVVVGAVTVVTVAPGGSWKRMARERATSS